jgi:hypothetical protein
VSDRMYSGAGIYPITTWHSSSTKDTHISTMMALTWDKHPLVKTIYSMQRSGNAGSQTVNTPSKIQARGLRTPRKGTTTHCSDETRQHLTGSPVPTSDDSRP